MVVFQESRMSLEWARRERESALSFQSLVRDTQRLFHARKVVVGQVSGLR